MAQAHTSTRTVTYPHAEPRLAGEGSIKTDDQPLAVVMRSHNEMRIERITSAQVESPKILVVDDDPAIRRLFVAWLTASGHSVRTASDAFEAVDVLRGEVVGAMICDIQMPLYDGNWLIEEVADAHPCLPIIVVTGFPETDRQVTRRPSVIRHVAKPVEREELSAGG